MLTGSGRNVSKEIHTEANLFVLELQIEELNELYTEFVMNPSHETARKWINRYAEIFIECIDENEGEY